MRLILKPLVLSLLALTIIVLLAIQYLPDQNLSKDQKETIKLFGYPHQFVITYLPSGEESSDTVTRTEVWYYDAQKVKINFMGGRVFNIEDFDNNELKSVEPTNLKPEDFSLTMSLEDTIGKLNDKNHAPLDIFPDTLSEDNLNTYISTEAVFTIENEYLTYFQTIGMGNESK